MLIERIQNRLARALESQGSAKAIKNYRGAALGSSVGLVRKRNEDCCLVARASYSGGSRAAFTVAVVCDGLGGMSEGREAAILAASAFTAHLFCNQNYSLQHRLSPAIEYANAEIYRRLRGSGGTTLSAVVYGPNIGAMFCHVGDSRIFGISSDRVIEQLSRDDTMKALLNRGDTESSAPKDSRLLQFVGMGDEMESQISFVPPHCRSVLITSDGAHDVPTSILQRIVSAAAGGSDLIRKLLALSDMLGGQDNASAILLPIGVDAEPSDEVRGNELVVILPNDTLAIHTIELEAGNWSRLPRTPAEGASEEPVGQIEVPAPRSDSVISSPEKQLPDKTKGRATKTRKTKRRSSRAKAAQPDRLPLEDSAEGVDVQFSAPPDQLDENKE